jgi:hypothetical protein
MPKLHEKRRDIVGGEKIWKKKNVYSMLLHSAMGRAGRERGRDGDLKKYDIVLFSITCQVSMFMLWDWENLICTLF